MNISDEGLDDIRRDEALRLQAYQDSGGVWTIGYGTTRYENGEPVREGDVVDAGRAEELLRWHVNENVVKPLNDLIRVSLPQHRFDALCSMAYNVGVHALSVSTLMKKLNAWEPAAAADEFVRWRYVGGKPSRGLFNRRVREMALFLWGRK